MRKTVVATLTPHVEGAMLLVPEAIVKAAGWEDVEWVIVEVVGCQIYITKTTEPQRTPEETSGIVKRP